MPQPYFEASAAASGLPSLVNAGAATAFSSARFVATGSTATRMSASCDFPTLA